MTDMAKELLSLEGEKIDVVSEKDMVISDAALETLLDRSPEVFAQRALGWTSAESERRASGKNVAFEVFEQQADEANEGLAHMMGEEERGRGVVERD
jgi:ATP-dependent DNA helicase